MPLYPFLCLGAGRFVDDLIRAPRLLPAAVFVLTGVFYTLNFTVSHEFVTANAGTMRWWVVLLALAFLGPLVVIEVWHTRITRRLAQGAIVASLLVLVIGSGHFIWSYDRIEKEYLNFDVNPFYSH